MRRILLAVGKAATALQTARQIRPWLRERDTSLTLLAVVSSSPASPLSDTKRTLEQVESVFTDAAEQPGIIVRVGNDPAAEICRETRHGQYDLVAVGLRDSPQAHSPIGSTCRQVLECCPVPLFVSPPALHVGITPQVLVVVNGAPTCSHFVDWVIAQCRAQKLNAILYAGSAAQSDSLARRMTAHDIRTQTVVHSELSADGIHALSEDRHVRWIMVPTGISHQQTSPTPLVTELLGKTGCPVLLEPGFAS